jgi:hypothetical protein
MLCGFYTASSLPFLGFLAFLFSRSFFFFQKSRHSMDSTENVSTRNEVAMKNGETQEEDEREEEVVQASACRKEVQEAVSNCSEVQCDLLEFSSEFSTESISDDESLIEISLPGNHVEDYSDPVFQEELKEEFIWDLLPESVFKQNGLMELLSEINEDDNMIEIDIARGSIKCSSLGIMA